YTTLSRSWTVRRLRGRVWSREMNRRVYEPRLIPVRTRSGHRVRAPALLADPAHPALGRELDLHVRARMVAQGIGQRGHCIDYIQNTVEHMHELGVRDPHLERILHAAIALRDNQAR